MSEESFPVYNVGDCVNVYSVDQPARKMKVYLILDDNAIFLTEPVVSASKPFPEKSVTIATTGKFNDIKLSAGDKITISTSRGKIDMYVSYLIGKTGLVLNYKKAPIKTSIKWLLRLL